MKTWRTAVIAARCGAEPGCTIHPGEPYLELAGLGANWRKVRCEQHAGEPVNREQVQASMGGPADVQVNPPVPRFTAARDLTADWKQKASGE